MSSINYFASVPCLIWLTLSWY